MSGRGQQDWRVQQQRFADAEARALDKERRAQERAQAAQDKEDARTRKEARRAEVEAETAALDARVAELSKVLPKGLERFGPLRLASLRRTAEVAELELGADSVPVPAPIWREPAAPGPLAALLGGRRRYERDRDATARVHALRQRRAEDEEAARQRRVGQRRREHAKAKQKAESEVAAHNEDLRVLQQRIEQREPAGVQRLAELVLERVPQPRGIARRFEVVVSPHGDQVVVRWELPARDAIPTTRAVQYVPTKNEKRLVARPQKEVAELYRDLVAQVSLLVVRSLLVSDPALGQVSFSGHVDAIDPATGADGYPCLLSLAVDSADLPPDENLARVDASTCVRSLGALVSHHPYAHEPVEPFLDFDLTRFAFVVGRDAVSTLDSRPNLLEISPSLFEHLVRQVLMQKGDEGWTTTESHDDGVDAVILNRSSIMGGLSVVQAKRYKPSAKLGPAHIRELAGTMEEKKAGWGVLVTTSTFTAGSEKKAREHGRMELIDGPKLCWHIKERLGKDVLIG